MNKQEQAVAALIQPDGERKHDIDVRHYGDENYRSCLKCKTPDAVSCPHPDPITICDDPEDKAAYEASMGKAVVWYRKAYVQDENKVVLASIKVMRDSMGDDIDYLMDADEWVRIEATPSQIFEIILKAIKETK